MKLTVQQLRAIVPTLSEQRAAWVLAGMEEAANWADVTTRKRLAAFIAQWAHESAGFKYLREIWGPTPAQVRYEGRADLGNTQRGDGQRYCGRGWAQLTGRFNYRKYGQMLGLPLETQPELAERPDVAWRIAAAYWRDHNINTLADAGDFEAVTRKVNGGLNGYADRLAYYQRALQVIPEQSAGQVLLVDGGGNTVPWDGKLTTYGGAALDGDFVSRLRATYPQAGGPWQHGNLKVWVRQNGDMVLEKPR